MGTKYSEIFNGSCGIMTNDSTCKIMAHLVAGNPDRSGFAAAVRAMADGGIEILELQLPFSDPTADGPLNTEAGELALRNGFKMADLDWYLDLLLSSGFEEVHVMAYANQIYRQGIESFVERLDKKGITGIIIPDLPLEDEEGFYQAAEGLRIDALPVVVVNMAEERRELLYGLKPNRCYVSLRQGVTGSQTDIGKYELDFLDSLEVGKIYGGFGIKDQQQVAMLKDHVHAAVVGSFFTALIKTAEGDPDKIYQAVFEGVKRLKGKS